MERISASSSSVPSPPGNATRRVPRRPRAIVFDILVSEADEAQPESDWEFVEVALRHRGVDIDYPMVRLDTP
jgi:hypothetical protein